mmetsp:Transcript_13625/g.31469  ORF Transcript_13625/g.31469 Transcript_13625/m.31469 type:complete len:90 (+) Transcript_13625:248-517(+)
MFRILDRCNSKQQQQTTAAKQKQQKAAAMRIDQGRGRINPDPPIAIELLKYELSYDSYESRSIDRLTSSYRLLAYYFSFSAPDSNLLVS